MSASTLAHDRSSAPRVAIVGTDAVLAAAPATPVQFAHACLRHGFAVAVPASWGDELIAGAVLRQLASQENGPAVLCTCPFVRARLLGPGPDLAPFLVSLVAPPVATARYLRAVYGTHGVHITYIGGCPGADDPVIDARLTPDAFLAELAERDIALSDQPLVFDSIVPPDRRRWQSLPGGAPSPELLWNEGHARTLIEIDRDDITTDLAQHIIGRDNVLLDLAPSLGCACSGAVASLPGPSARIAVAALEPPRARGPVIDPIATVRLDAPVVRSTDEHLDHLRAPAAPPEPVEGAERSAPSAPRVVAETTAIVLGQLAAAELGEVAPDSASSPPLWVEPTPDGTPEPGVAGDPRTERDVESSIGIDAGTSEHTMREHETGSDLSEHRANVGAAVVEEPEAADTPESAPVPGHNPPVRRRTPSATLTRYPTAAIPKRADTDGRILPRAYVARRRTPASGPAALAPEEPSVADIAVEGPSGPAGGETAERLHGDPPPSPPSPVASEPAAERPQSLAAQSDDVPARRGADDPRASESPANRPARQTPATSATHPNQGALMVLLVVALLALGVFVLGELR